MATYEIWKTTSSRTYIEADDAQEAVNRAINGPWEVAEDVIDELYKFDDDLGYAIPTSEDWRHP